MNNLNCTNNLNEHYAKLTETDCNKYIM